MCYIVTYSCYYLNSTRGLKGFERLSHWPPSLPRESHDNIFITSFGDVSYCIINLIAGILSPYQTWIFHATVNSISFTTFTELEIEYLSYFLCAFVPTESWERRCGILCSQWEQATVMPGMAWTSICLNIFAKLCVHILSIWMRWCICDFLKKNSYCKTI